MPVVYVISSACAGAGNCVAVGLLQSGRIVVRDTKNPHAGSLVFTPVEWDAFLKGVTAGDFAREQLQKAQEKP